MYYATDNHEWFVRSTKNDKVSVQSTKNLNLRRGYIPQYDASQAYCGPSITGGLLAKSYLLGMYVAEGHKRPSKKAFFVPLKRISAFTKKS